MDSLNKTHVLRVAAWLAALSIVAVISMLTSQDYNFPVKSTNSHHPITDVFPSITHSYRRGLAIHTCRAVSASFLANEVGGWSLQNSVRRKMHDEVVALDWLLSALISGGLCTKSARSLTLVKMPKKLTRGWRMITVGLKSIYTFKVHVYAWMLGISEPRFLSDRANHSY